MQFQREPVLSLKPEGHEMPEAHYREVFGRGGFNPDWIKYDQAERAGRFRVYTARVNGQVVGYAGFFLRQCTHSKATKEAVQDSLYIAPEHRGGAGSEFIAWCDEDLRKDNVQVVYHHVNVRHDFGNMLKRQGYELVDYVYAKRLDM